MRLSKVFEGLFQFAAADRLQQESAAVQLMGLKGILLISGKPKVIFLDEATSALDNVTQNMVMETLQKIDATKLVTAHRLSTVKNSDRIIVMDKGTIVEQGTYDELMAMKEQKDKVICF